MKKELHVSPAEVLVLEVHEVAFFDEFDHFVEFVHIQLPDERRQVSVPEEIGQDLVLEFFRLFYENFGVAVPREIVAVIFMLGRVKGTSRMW